MTQEEKINQLTLEIMKGLIYPSVVLQLDKCLANDGDPDRPSDDVLDHYFDEGMPYHTTQRAGSTLAIKLNAWGPNHQKMTGVTFADNFEVPMKDASNLENLDLQGTIENGPGRRILFEALGNRTFTCSAAFPYDVFEPEILSNEGASFTFDPQHLRINFQSETVEELQNILAKLEAAKVEVDKYMMLSTLKEDYTPFRSWV